MLSVKDVKLIYLLNFIFANNKKEPYICIDIK